MSNRVLGVMYVLMAAVGNLYAEDVAIVIDGRDQGRNYEGIGGVSAGASSMLYQSLPVFDERSFLSYCLVGYVHRG